MNTPPTLLTASAIPDFTTQTLEGASQWWDEMLKLGLYVNPDDGAENHVHSKTNDPVFDASAIKKIDSIYEKMFSLLGRKKTYNVGTTAWWNYQGYTWNEKCQEWMPKKALN